MNGATVRGATTEDLPAIAAIYGAAVRTSVATFDVEDPPLGYWLARLESPQPGDHVLVAEADGGVLGYAYSGAFRPRLGYRLTRETSVYIAPAAQGRGVGRALYAALLRLMRSDGIHLAVAVVAQPNPASVALHRALGFSEVGTLHEVGRKFDRWVDTTWFELRL